MADPITQTEFADLVSRHLDGTLSDADAARLRASLTADSSMRDLFVTICVQARLLGEPLVSGMSQTTDAEAVVTPIAAAALTPTRRATGRHRSLWRIGAIAAAAALLVGVSLAIYLAGAIGSSDDQASPPGPVMAILMGSSDAQWVSTPMNPGDEVRGRAMSLASGVVQMQMNDGGAVMVSGPAEVRFASPKLATLDAGWMRVRGIPGFTVDAPNGVSVIDQSTEFEVGVGTGGAVGVRVIEGRVRVVSRTDAFEERSVAAGELVLFDADGSPSNDEARLIEVSGIDRRPSVHLPLVNSGAGLNPGDRDAHWSIVTAMADESFRPGPAVALRNVPATYLRDSASDARWISVDEPNGIARAGAVYTYRVIVDLDEFDPSTARIAGRVAVDNTILSIRINSTPIGGLERVIEGFDRWRDFAIEHGFVHGKNVIEFDVLNANDGLGDNPTGLLVDWSGEAMPEWIGRD